MMVAVMDRPITAAVKRKMNRTVRGAVMLAIVSGDSKKVGGLDPELMPINRIMERWAVSVGSGLPTDDEWEPRSRPTPLDDASSTVVDQIVIHAPHRYRLLLLPWYKGSGSSTTIQEKLGVTRHGLYLEWRCSLFFVKQEIRRIGHQDLIDLLDVFID